MRIHNGANAGLLHARSGATEEFDVRSMAAQRLHQTGGVQVPRRFTGGD